MDITHLAQDAISRVIKNDKTRITILDVVTIAMTVVEQIKDEKKLDGEGKKKFAKEIFVLIIDLLANIGKIQDNQASSLKEDLKVYSDLVDEFIDMAAFLTNNPYLINAGKWIVKESKEAIATCCKGKCNLV